MGDEKKEKNTLEFCQEVMKQRSNFESETQ